MELITRRKNETPQKFIERLSAENHAFYESPRGEGSLREFGQKFPHSWIYVAELIQNAIDEKATIISFKILDENILIFEHNGELFDFDRDIIGLCTKGMSSKGAGTVGFMGVGFKSVFGSYQRVNVSSGEWSFYLQVKFRTGDRYGDKHREWLGAMCPKWDEAIETPSEGMTCRFELKDRCVENKSIASDLSEVLKKDQSLLPLLARQGVHTLIWNDTVWKLSITERVPFEDNTGARIHIEAHSGKSTKEPLSWLIFSQEYSPSRFAVRRFLEHRQLYPNGDAEKEKTYQEASRNRRVEVFFKLNEKGFPIFPKVGEAFALLPTNIKLPIGVHIQADWLLTQSRQEFMDSNFKNNAWHREIIMNIPRLTKQFYRWIVSESGPSSGEWALIHNILPALDERALETYSWFFGGDEDDLITTSPFLKRLRKELELEEMLPTHLPDNTVGFKTPAEARLLPESLDEECGEADLKPWELFGEKVVNTQHLEEKSINTLTKLGLLSKLTAAELEGWWSDDRVKTWYESFTEQDRFDKLSKLLAGLAPLDSDPTWKSANFSCIPSENGAFISRGKAILYPKDWSSVADDESMKNMLKGILNLDELLVDWKFQQHVQDSYTKANKFFKEIRQLGIDEWTDCWWDNLSTENLEPQTIDEIINFTCHVCKNYANSQNWIKKVLCENSDAQPRLLPLQDTLLADPYTESHRRVYFSDLPVISSKYYEYDSTADWKTFFDSCKPSPQGKLRLYYKSKIEKRWEFFKHFGGELPEQRSSYIRLNVFGSVEIANDEFGIIDFTFDNKLKQTLFEVRNDTQLKKLLPWLLEDIGYFEMCKEVRIYYIPYFSSEEKLLPNDWVPEWIKLLRDNPWLFSTDNRGPFKPADILAAYDAARPDAPVVPSIPERLVRIFAKHNIVFGSAIPKPGPIRELQVHGHSWSVEKVSETIAEILEDAATTEEDRQNLANLLMNEPLLPLPSDIHLADRLIRVSLNRIVKRAGQKNRNDLGWVVAEQELRTQTEYERFFTLVEPIISTPEHLTGDQVIDFLQWIWKTEPETETVRKALPLAYSYIIEDCAQNPEIEVRWNLLLDTAKVFTLGGNWAKVSDGPGVFFDDIGFPNYNVIPKTRRVTPSHLGSNNKPDTQKAAAALLNVLLLSEKYELVAVEGDELPIPSEWNRNFATLYVVLAELLRQNKSTDEDDDDETSAESAVLPDKRSPLTLRLVSKLENVARKKETAEIIDSKALSATLEGSVAIVSGEPDDFAPELCMLMFQYFNAARRQNLVPITNQVTLLLSHIGDKKYLERLNKFTKKHGLKEVKQLVNAGDEQPTDEDAPPTETASTKPDDDDNVDSENHPDNDLKDDIDDLNLDDLDIDDVLGFYGHGTDRKYQENAQPSPPPRKEPGTPSSFATNARTGGSTRRSDSTSNDAAPPVTPGHGKASSASHTHSPSNRRLFSYVQSANHANADDHSSEAENENETMAVGCAGEFAAMDFERLRGWTPTKMPHNNPGYDIESIGPNGEKIYIEVKGVSGEWSASGVAVSPTQFEFAQRNPETTWLYVVENAGIAGEERVYPIPSPATQVTEFRFDNGWKSVAQVHDAVAVNVGKRVRYLNGEQKTGTITKATSRGKLLKITIKFDDDTELETIFSPDRFEFV